MGRVTLEKPPEYYDNLYSISTRSVEHYSTSKYYGMWKRVALIVSSLCQDILDFGCGAGQLLQMLRDNGIAAYGSDVSDVAVEICNRKGLPVFHTEDSNLKSLSVNTVIATEVFEHIENDIETILSFGKCDIVFSVPSFGDVSHVRCFRSKQDIVRRYGHVVTIHKIWKYKRRFLVFGAI